MKKYCEECKEEVTAHKVPFHPFNRLKCSQGHDLGTIQAGTAPQVVEHGRPAPQVERENY